MEFDSYVFSKQPGFVEPEIRMAFKQAVPLRTVVVYCYDPRAVNIPEAVARAIPGEVYPGEILRDNSGKDRFDYDDFPGCGRGRARRGCPPLHNSRTTLIWNREHRRGAPHVLWSHVVHCRRSDQSFQCRAGR